LNQSGKNGIRNDTAVLSTEVQSTGITIFLQDLCNTLYNGDNAKVPCFNCGDVGKTIARNDIKQGTTGDCWFLCSVSGVSMVRELISVVIPSDNETNDEGVYHFRLTRLKIFPFDFPSIIPYFFRVHNVP